MRNFNDVFRKDVTCDNIWSHKKQSQSFSAKHMFGKTTGGSNWPHPTTHPLPAVFGLSNSKTNSRKGLLLEVTKYFFYNLVTWKSLWCRVITNVITCLFLKSLLYQTLFDILIFETRNFSFEVIFRCWGCFTYNFLRTSNSNYYKGVWNSTFLH